MDKRILVIDDEDTLCQAIAFNLEAAGYEVSTAGSAEQALAMDIEKFSLILLDVMLPGISGTQMAVILKQKRTTAHIPIIFVTARDADEDVIQGLDIGADDYITKPFSVGQLMARVRTALRRVPQPPIPADTKTGNDPRHILTFRTLVVDTAAKTCHIDGNAVKLPRKEFEILATLMSHPGKLFSREDLLRRCWPDEVIVVDRVVDVNITRLRSKLGTYAQNIHTRHGYGYEFVQ